MDIQAFARDPQIFRAPYWFNEKITLNSTDACINIYRTLGRILSYFRNSFSLSFHCLQFISMQIDQSFEHIADVAMF